MEAPSQSIQDFHPSVAGCAAEAVEARPPRALAHAVKAVIVEGGRDCLEPRMSISPALGRCESFSDPVLDLDESLSELFQVLLDQGREEIQQDESAEPVRDVIGDGREL